MGGETEVTEVVVNQLGGRTPRRRKFLMPQGTPFHGLIPPFPIRVDQFGALPGLLVDLQVREPSLFTLRRKSSCVTLSPSLSHFSMPIIVLALSCTSRVYSEQMDALISDSS